MTWSRDLLPGRKGLEILEFVAENSGCTLDDVDTRLGRGDTRPPRSLSLWSRIQEEGIGPILSFMKDADLLSQAENRFTITDRGEEFLSSHPQDRKQPARLSAKPTGDDKRLLGGGVCPVCKQRDTLWEDWPGVEYAVCSNCGTEYALDYPRAQIVYGESEYLHKQLLDDGWKMVREGKEPFLCPGCGSQPKDLKKDWKGKFKPTEKKKLRCDCCGRDLVVVGNDIAEAPTVDVVKSPKYEAKVEVAVDYAWPDCCCICLGTPVVWEPLDIEGSAVVGQYETKVKRTLAVPYCQGCLDKEGKSAHGIWAWPIVMPFYGQTGLIARFRNPEYARMFRELNPLVHPARTGHPWPPPYETG